jgi:hypothetical protein
VDRRAASRFHCSAAARSSIARATAPASRIGPQASFTLVEPPVNMMPSSRPTLAITHCTPCLMLPRSSGWKGRFSRSTVRLPKILSIGACEMRTLASEASSSSASSIGSAVFTPCPISLRGTTTETVPSARSRPSHSGRRRRLPGGQRAGGAQALARRREAPADHQRPAGGQATQQETAPAT